MPELDPDAQAILDVTIAMRLPPIYTLTIAEARERMRATLIANGKPRQLVDVEDVAIPTPHGALPMRLYRPTHETLPVALFLHGGGWALNDLDTHDDLCRRIAARSGWLLGSLDFRRAPEHKHPASVEDAYVGYRWLVDNAPRLDCDPTCRAVVGESSGGTTAAALTLLLREVGAPMPTYQIVAYPVMDREGQWPSYAERGTGYALDVELIKWFFDQYLPSDYDARDPYLFPLAARDFSDLPPALVITAEFDPLRDEGIAYSEKLARAGVPVAHLHARDQMHGFLLQSRAVAKAGEIIDHLADALRSHRVQGQIRTR